MNAMQLAEALDLPLSRAERTLELMEKDASDGVTIPEFYEMAANFIVRREMAENEKVSRYGVATTYGLKSAPGRTIVKEFKDRFGEPDDWDDVREEAMENAPVYITPFFPYYLYHMNDVGSIDGETGNVSEVDAEMYHTKKEKKAKKPERSAFAL